MNVSLWHDDVLLDAIDSDDILGSSDAFTAVDRIFEHVAKALRRDPRFPRLSRNELDLLLADARRESDEELVELVNGKIDVHTAISAVMDVLTAKAPT